MSGLFVRKHAEAVSQYCDVTVLHVRADNRIKTFEMIEQTNKGIREIYVYYPCSWNKIFKQINYLRAYRKGFKHLRRLHFSPDIIHANVLTRTALIAYWYKKLQGVPYVVMEHWTRYLPQNFNYKGIIRKKITEIVARNASCIMTVSKDLKQAMLKNNIRGNYEVVYNVVDDFFFEKRKREHRASDKKRILHVSCFCERQKNVKGILRAALQLSKQRTDFELILVGTGVDFDAVYDYAQTLNFPSGMITFTGEQTPEKTAEWFRSSDVFILFSNYENAPVVISESLAMGVPIISSNVGGIAEMVNETNGKLVAACDESILTETMNDMLNHLNKYDADTISKNAKCFTYKEVGEIIYQIYKKQLNR
jgi:glycosyltransferase involved in cell wall biosynthesis